MIIVVPTQLLDIFQALTPKIYRPPANPKNDI
jgi:hypothetical protein